MITDQIPWAVISVVLTSGIFLIAIVNFYLNHLRTEESDIHIRQRFGTEAVIKQNNRHRFISLCGE